MPTSRLHRPYYRNGPEHRSGADVTFQDIVKLFGFRTVTIGQWVTREEQQIAANLMFDALCDLMALLGVPESVVSLNGALSLAFGSGGQKHASAHYEPASRTLALAKNAGGGALAHEWFHAFDHYICQHMFTSFGQLDFASQHWIDDNTVRPHPLNELLSDTFADMFLSADGEQPSHYLIRSVHADKALGTYYYARPQELAARAFEAILQSQPQKNHFLVQGTLQSVEAQVGIYPTSEEKNTIQVNLLAYFRLLGKALTEH